jgi:site-specific DNA recombinase
MVSRGVLVHRFFRAEIDAERVGCVVVYRADRLSRRILDFLQLMEQFDLHGVSFVSVTEQFSTATQGGRLYQHMLLSFAQYERELRSAAISKA